MLQILIPTMQNSMLAILFLAVVMAFVEKNQPQGPKEWIWRGVLLGSIGALGFAALKLASVFIKKEIYDGVVLMPALGLETLLLISFWRFRRYGGAVEGTTVPAWLPFGLPALVLLHRGFELFLSSGSFALPAAGGVNQEYFLKWTGYLLGIAVAWLTGIAVHRVARALSEGALLTVTTAVFGVVMAQQAVVVIQVLLARGVLPMKKWLLAVMIPLINHQDWFLYSLLAMLTALPVLLVMQRRPARAEGQNPAQYRKVLAAARKQLRWGGVAIVSLLLAVFLSTFGKAYADRAAELSPAVPVTVQQGEIRIPLDKVEDGRLHRYVYTAGGGTAVRFIIIKKGGSAYGVGLDACDICGPTGYYERDDQVVCKLCDVVMNKATIGFKGGCNPVPLEYKVAAGQIVIAAQSLEKEKKRFQ